MTVVLTVKIVIDLWRLFRARPAGDFGDRLDEADRENPYFDTLSTTAPAPAPTTAPTGPATTAPAIAPVAALCSML
jgi:hypothetical protein